MAEVVLVIPLIGLITTCTVLVALALLRLFETATLQGDLKSDTTRAAYRIFRRCGRSCHLAGDNRGLLFADGSSVRWEGERLELRATTGRRQSLLAYPVRSFLVTRREGILSLHLEVTAPQHWRGQPLTYRVVYDAPRAVAP